MNIKEIAKNILFDTYKASTALFKIMIPVSIVVRILQETGLIHNVGDALNPLMKLVGLPGEMGLVWATTMITNLYGGILALVAIQGSVSLTVAQVTVLTTMMLVAHTFPIELQVARKAGVKLRAMFILRFSFALVLGILLNWFYKSFDMLQQHAVITFKTNKVLNPSWLEWGISEIKNYGIILLVIFSLILMMKILNLTGVIKLITKLFKPILGVMGIGSEVITITIIGLTLGIAYGGALIIKETEQKKVKVRDVFYALTLMGLCHSMIEDTLLMIALGGDISGVLFARIIFAFIVTYLIVRFTKNLSNEFFKKYLVRE
ncbi:MAG: nucleoside recognition domain-containing protein [Bacteroidota bacterium]